MLHTIRVVRSNTVGGVSSCIGRGVHRVESLLLKSASRFSYVTNCQRGSTTKDTFVFSHLVLGVVCVHAARVVLALDLQRERVGDRLELLEALLPLADALDTRERDCLQALRVILYVSASMDDIRYFPRDLPQPP